jgi:hypothetical protein
MDVKSIFASKTIWGAVIMLAPTIAGLLGLNLTSADATAAVDHASGIVNNVIEVVGFFMVLWGRMTATKAVTLTGK